MTDLTPEQLAAYHARFTLTAPVSLSPTAVQTLAPATAVLTPGGGTLSDADSAYLRSELGPDVDLADAQIRYARLGSVKAVVLEVLREQLAALTAGPAQYAISGVYSQDTSANIAALREQLTRISAGPVDGGLPEVTRISTRPRRSR